MMCAMRVGDDCAAGEVPLGQTVTKVNEARERTHMFSRCYLEEQLLTVLAGARAPLPWLLRLAPHSPSCWRMRYPVRAL